MVHVELFMWFSTGGVINADFCFKGGIVFTFSAGGVKTQPYMME